MKVFSGVLGWGAMASCQRWKPSWKLKSKRRRCCSGESFEEIAPMRNLEAEDFPGMSRAGSLEANGSDGIERGCTSGNRCAVDRCELYTGSGPSLTSKTEVASIVSQLYELTSPSDYRLLEFRERRVQLSRVGSELVQKTRKALEAQRITRTGLASQIYETLCCECEEGFHCGVFVMRMWAISYALHTMKALNVAECFLSFFDDTVGSDQRSAALCEMFRDIVHLYDESGRCSAQQDDDSVSYLGYSMRLSRSLIVMFVRTAIHVFESTQQSMQKLSGEPEERQALQRKVLAVSKTFLQFLVGAKSPVDLRQLTVEEAVRRRIMSPALKSIFHDMIPALFTTRDARFGNVSQETRISSFIDDVREYLECYGTESNDPIQIKPNPLVQCARGLFASLIRVKVVDVSQMVEMAFSAFTDVSTELLSTDVAIGFVEAIVVLTLSKVEKLCATSASEDKENDDSDRQQTSRHNKEISNAARLEVCRQAWLLLKRCLASGSNDAYRSCMDSMLVFRAWYCVCLLFERFLVWSVPKSPFRLTSDYSDRFRKFVIWVLSLERSELEAGREIDAPNCGAVDMSAELWSLLSNFLVADHPHALHSQLSFLAGCLNQNNSNLRIDVDATLTRDSKTNLVPTAVDNSVQLRLSADGVKYVKGIRRRLGRLGLLGFGGLSAVAGSISTKAGRSPFAESNTNIKAGSGGKLATCAGPGSLGSSMTRAEMRKYFNILCDCIEAVDCSDNENVQVPERLLRIRLFNPRVWNELLLPLIFSSGPKAGGAQDAFNDVVPLDRLMKHRVGLKLVRDALVENGTVEPSKLEGPVSVTTTTAATTSDVRLDAFKSIAAESGSLADKLGRLKRILNQAVSKASVDGTQNILWEMSIVLLNTLRQSLRLRLVSALERGNPDIRTVSNLAELESVSTEVMSMIPDGCSRSLLQYSLNLLGVCVCVDDTSVAGEDSGCDLLICASGFESLCQSSTLPDAVVDSTIYLGLLCALKKLALSPPLGRRPIDCVSNALYVLERVTRPSCRVPKSAKLYRAVWEWLLPLVSRDIPCYECGFCSSALHFRWSDTGIESAATVIGEMHGFRDCIGLGQLCCEGTGALASTTYYSGSGNFLRFFILSVLRTFVHVHEASVGAPCIDVLLRIMEARGNRDWEKACDDLRVLKAIVQGTSVSADDLDDSIVLCNDGNHLSLEQQVAVSLLQKTMLSVDFLADVDWHSELYIALRAIQKSDAIISEILHFWDVMNEWIPSRKHARLVHATFDVVVSVLRGLHGIVGDPLCIEMGRVPRLHVHRLLPLEWVDANALSVVEKPLDDWIVSQLLHENAVNGAAWSSSGIVNAYTVLRKAVYSTEGPEHAVLDVSTATLSQPECVFTLLYFRFCIRSGQLEGLPLRQDGILNAVKPSCQKSVRCTTMPAAAAVTSYRYPSGYAEKAGPPVNKLSWCTTAEQLVSNVLAFSDWIRDRMREWIPVEGLNHIQFVSRLEEISAKYPHAVPVSPRDIIQELLDVFPADALDGTLPSRDATPIERSVVEALLRLLEHVSKDCQDIRVRSRVGSLTLYSMKWLFHDEVGTSAFYGNELWSSEKWAQSGEHELAGLLRSRGL